MTVACVDARSKGKSAIPCLRCCVLPVATCAGWCAGSQLFAPQSWLRWWRRYPPDHSHANYRRAQAEISIGDELTANQTRTSLATIPCPRMWITEDLREATGFGRQSAVQAHHAFATVSLLFLEESGRRRLLRHRAPEDQDFCRCDRTAEIPYCPGEERSGRKPNGLNCARPSNRLEGLSLHVPARETVPARQLRGRSGQGILPVRRSWRRRDIHRYT